MNQNEAAIRLKEAWELLQKRKPLPVYRRGVDHVEVDREAYEKVYEAVEALEAASQSAPAVLELGTDPPVFHKPDCVAVLDDESDYEHLADAGTCTCGARQSAQPQPVSGPPQDGQHHG